jgi:hypothetical protein
VQGFISRTQGFPAVQKLTVVAVAAVSFNLLLSLLQVDMLLFSLDQYSRTRLPGYTGFKPQDPKNALVVQPSQGPTRLTTKGATEWQAIRDGPKAQDTANFLDSAGGIMSFFADGRLTDFASSRPGSPRMVLCHQHIVSSAPEV